MTRPIPSPYRTLSFLMHSGTNLARWAAKGALWTATTLGTTILGYVCVASIAILMTSEHCQNNSSSDECKKDMEEFPLGMTLFASHLTFFLGLSIYKSFTQHGGIRPKKIMKDFTQNIALFYGQILLHVALVHGMRNYNNYYHDHQEALSHTQLGAIFLGDIIGVGAALEYSTNRPTLPATSANADPAKNNWIDYLCCRKQQQEEDLLPR